MLCPSCKSRLQPGVRFCGICGHKLPQGKSDYAQEDEGATEIDPQARFVPDKSGDPFVGLMLNNRFLIEDKLGEGGFGAVYRGTQTGTGRKVAIKLLHPDMTRDDNLVARFRREGLVLCNLRDAHTVTTYDFDQTADGTLYIAMELLEGKSLHEIFQNEAPLAWRRMFKVLTEMCSSLAEAHAQGIVHRDLKPENIYLETRPGHPDFVKILDFGIAKVMRGDGVGGKATQLTATGQTLGTLEYMSPEQLMGKPLDGRSDIYALGVLAYEMITGRLPFPDAKGPAGLITAQLRQVPDPPSVANRGGGIPPAVDQLILKMLAKNQADRFADVTELRDAINQILAQPQQAPGAPGGYAGQQMGQQAGQQMSQQMGQQMGGPQMSRPMSSPPPVTVASMPARQPAQAGQGMHSGMQPMQGMQAGQGMHSGMQPMQGMQAGQGMHSGMQPMQSGQQAMQAGQPMQAMQAGQPQSMQSGTYGPYPAQQSYGGVPSYAPPAQQGSASSRLWLWIVLGIIALGGVVGAVLALA